MIALTADADIAREETRRKGLRGFVGYFWQYADPNSQFVANWHVDAICDHLEALRERWIKDLVINIPPRMGKSLIVDTLFPAYVWTTDPSHPFIHASYDKGLCLRDAGRMRDIMASAAYREAFPGTQLLMSSPLGNLQTVQHGRRFSTTPGAAATGWGAKTVSVNDPIKPKDAAAKLPVVLENVASWWKGTMANRRDGDPADFARVITMQRLAENDLSGIALELGYEHLCLPMRYVPNATWDRGSSLSPYDPREEPGELLFPQAWDLETVDALEKEQSPADVEAQNQQNPRGRAGGYTEAAWLEHTYAIPPMPGKAIVRQYWDLNSKGRKESSHSRVAGIVVAYAHGRVHLLDWIAEHLNYPQTKDRFFALQDMHPWKQANKIWIEDKANGTPLLDDLAAEKEASRRAVARKCKGWQTGSLSKEERWAIETDKLEAGLWLFPSDKDCSEYRAEILGFPTRKPNDLVDVTGMALADLCTQTDKATAWRDAQRNLHNLVAGI